MGDGGGESIDRLIEPITICQTYQIWREILRATFVIEIRSEFNKFYVWRECEWLGFQIYEEFAWVQECERARRVIPTQ